MINVAELNSEEATYSYARKANRQDFEVLPELPEKLKWAFLRGLFDKHGIINQSSVNKTPVCVYNAYLVSLRESIREFVNLPVWDSKWYPDTMASLEWVGNNALDFMARLYEDSTFRDAENYNKYKDWATTINGITNRSSYHNGLKFEWFRNDASACAPFKARASDSAYDLTLIKITKQIGNITFYDTGITVVPPYGWYFDMVPRSSMAKSGYMLAHNVGVIDRSYTGSIMAPLLKHDPNAPDLELPARAVQIIPRPIIHLGMTEIDSLEQNGTGRGTGGFGSSGK